MTNRRTLLSILVGASVLSACGGTAESAEQPQSADVPVVEPAAPAAGVVTPTATIPAESTPAPEPAAPPPATPATTKRPAPALPDPKAEPEVLAPPTAPTRALDVGTTLTLSLDQALSTRSSRVGDLFSSRLVADVMAADGEILLPEGTVVRGRVTEAQESPSADVPALLRLQIVDVEIGGEAVPLVADVEQMQLETEAKDSDRRTAGKVAVGAAAGALVGKVLGKGATKGAVAGAAAGAVVAVTTRDGHATLPRGAQMTIRLVEPLVIR